jgi:serine/threonine protein kinase
MDEYWFDVSADAMDFASNCLTHDGEERFNAKQLLKHRSVMGYLLFFSLLYCPSFFFLLCTCASRLITFKWMGEWLLVSLSFSLSLSLSRSHYTHTAKMWYLYIRWFEADVSSHLVDSLERLKFFNARRLRAENLRADKLWDSHIKNLGYSMNQTMSVVVIQVYKTNHTHTVPPLFSKLRMWNITFCILSDLSWYLLTLSTSHAPPSFFLSQNTKVLCSSLLSSAQVSPGSSLTSFHCSLVCFKDKG